MYLVFVSEREKQKGENTMKSIILAVALVLFASSAYSTTYVLETSNALEKEGETYSSWQCGLRRRLMDVFGRNG